MLTLLFFLSLGLHAIHFFMHGLQQRFNGKVVERINSAVDRAVLAVDGIADELEPKTNPVNPKVAAAKSLAPILLCVAFGLGASQLTACAGNQRQTAISAAFAGANTVCPTFVAYDAQHEKDMLAGATSMADLNAKLADWDAKIAPLRKACSVVYIAIAGAAAANDDASLTTMKGIASELPADLKAIGASK